MLAASIHIISIVASMQKLKLSHCYMPSSNCVSNQLLFLPFILEIYQLSENNLLKPV